MGAGVGLDRVGFVPDPASHSRESSVTSRSALPSEGKGHTFESCRVRQNLTGADNGHLALRRPDSTFSIVVSKPTAVAGSSSADALRDGDHSDRADVRFARPNIQICDAHVVCGVSRWCEGQKQRHMAERESVKLSNICRYRAKRLWKSKSRTWRNW
jgi:hypothetical protein